MPPEQQRDSPGVDTLRGWRYLHGLEQFRCPRRSPGLESLMDAKPQTVFNNWIKRSVERMKSVDTVRFVGLSVADDFTTQEDVVDSPRAYVRSMCTNIKIVEYPLHTIILTS
jgi:hypothetical protein